MVELKGGGTRTASRKGRDGEKRVGDDEKKEINRVETRRGGSAETPIKEQIR